MTVFQQPLLLYAQHLYIWLKARILISREAVLNTPDKLPGPGMPLNFLMQGLAARIKIHHLDTPGPYCTHNRPNLFLFPNINDASGSNLIHNNTSGRNILGKKCILRLRLLHGVYPE
jgi:hypothetical protein